MSGSWTGDTFPTTSRSYLYHPYQRENNNKPSALLIGGIGDNSYNGNGSAGTTDLVASASASTTSNNISLINNKIFSLFPSAPSPSNVPKKMKMSDGLGGVTSVTIVTSPSVVAPTTMNSLNSVSAGGGVTTLPPNISAAAAAAAAAAAGVTTNNHLNNSSSSPCANNHTNTQNLADYLAQLIKDKKQLAIFPNLFIHVERILDEEIARVRGNLFHLSGTKQEPLELPEPIGPVVTLSEKVYVPVKEHPDFNFVGRILGPRGMTAKQLEQETGCKIMVRGKGSMRDKKKEEQNRGKPNWEHLNDELHVLITVEDTENRGKLKLQRAVDEVKKLLVPQAEGEDELKKRQLMELAIINGTYRDSKESRNTQAAVNAAAAQLVSPQVPLSALRAATPLGAPLIISPHRLTNGLSSAAAAAAAAAGAPPPLLAPGATDSLLYAASPYTATDYATYLSLAEYPPEHVGKMSGVRRLTGLHRDHPYLPKTDPSASLLH